MFEGRSSGIYHACRISLNSDGSSDSQDNSQTEATNENIQPITELVKNPQYISSYVPKTMPNNQHIPVQTKRSSDENKTKSFTTKNISSSHEKSAIGFNEDRKFSPILSPGKIVLKIKIIY